MGKFHCAKNKSVPCSTSEGPRHLNMMSVHRWNALQVNRTHFIFSLFAEKSLSSEKPLAQYIRGTTLPPGEGYPQTCAFQTDSATRQIPIDMGVGPRGHGVPPHDGHLPRDVPAPEKKSRKLSGKGPQRPGNTSLTIAQVPMHLGHASRTLSITCTNPGYRGIPEKMWSESPGNASLIIRDDPMYTRNTPPDLLTT